MTDPPEHFELSLFRGEPTRLPAGPRKRSPLAAFLLSLFVPGLGHFYCGKWKRGLTTLGLFLLGSLAALGLLGDPNPDSELAFEVAISVAFGFYVFGFLDAYFTAREMSEGFHELLPHNPRVAGLLNFVTNGFGYFYVGQRTKAIIVFVSLTTAGLLTSKLEFGQFWPLVAVVYALIRGYITVDAYRIAAREVKEARAILPAPAPIVKSRFAPVPLALACAVMGGYFVIVLLGSVFMALGVTDEEQAGIEAESKAAEAPRLSAGRPSGSPGAARPPSIQLPAAPATVSSPGPLLPLSGEMIREVGERLTEHDVRTYVSEALGLMLTLPKTWSYQVSENLVISAASGDAECTMTIFTRQSAGVPVLSEFVSSYSAQQLEASSGRKLQERRPISIYGAEAEELIYETTESGRARRESYVLARTARVLYSFETDALPNSRCEAEAAWIRGRIRIMDPREPG